jgi:putative flippase GtrA
MKVLFRYLVAGGTAALVHFAVLIMLVELADVDATIASMIGFCLAVIVNYTLQYHWTFEMSEPHGRILTKYIVITFTMLGVNTIIFWVLYEQVGVLYLVAQFIATGVVTVLNFLINKHYTFVSTCDTQKS